MVKVSVILPSLNVASYIRKCLKSVIDQTLKDIEIICVDAGSTDGTLEILQEYALLDPRVILLHSDQKSYGRQVNMGIAAACGEYIGIVETDDFVSVDMYKVLYEAAKENKPDMVKADWDEFIVLNGRRFCSKVALLQDHPELYGTIISASEYPWLYLRDITVWKGIYNRKFLIDHHLYFNESKGAAYQDYGYSVLTLTYGEKILYLSQSLYRYQKSREGASSWNPGVLRFAYQEWKRLLEENLIQGENRKWDYIYQRMADSFLGEFDKSLEIHNYNLASENIQPYYQWFKERLENIIDENPLPARYENQKQWERLRLALYSPEAYRDLCVIKKQIQRENLEEVTNWAAGYDIIIFGCGIYGKKACFTLYSNGIKPRAFCDNNKKQWNSYINGLPVLSPDVCFSSMGNARYLVANKLYWHEIKKQLLEMGISGEQIMIFMP